MNYKRLFCHNKEPFLHFCLLAGTLSEAKEGSKTAQQTSELSKSDVNETSRKRARKQTVRFTSSRSLDSQSDSSAEDSDAPLETLRING